MSGLLVAASIWAGVHFAPPMGYIDFCKKYPRECLESRPAVIERTTDLDHVNWLVNNSIRYESEHPRDVYQLAPDRGDCEDYAVTKMSVLVGMGYPRGAFALAKVQLDKKDKLLFHMVLVAYTKEGPLVLDNAVPDIVSVYETPYIWRKIASQGRPFVWKHASTEFPDVKHR